MTGTVEIPHTNEVITPALVEACLEEANTIRQLMFKKRLPQTDIFGLQKVPTGTPAPEAALQVGWQARLFEPQDVQTFHPDRYSARILLINPLSVDRVYLDGNGQVIKRDFTEGYGLYPEQNLISGKEIRWNGHLTQKANEDDLATLKIILEDAVTSLRI